MWQKKLVPNESRRNYSVSEPKYHATNFFFPEKSLSREMKQKMQLFTNKPVF